MLALLASACSGNTKPSAQDVANSFLTALTRDDMTTAAGDTDNATAAKTTLNQVHAALKPTALSASLGQVNASNSTATASFTLAWTFGPGRIWNDASSFGLTKNSNGDWLVHWAPSVLNPKLTAGQTLARSASDPVAPTVLGSDGSTLLAPTNVISVMVYSTLAGTNLPSVAGTLAGALTQFDSTITTQSIVDGATKAGAAGYTVVSLRDSDYQQVKAQIYNLPGVRFSTRSELLAQQKGFGAAILPQIRNAIQRQLDAQAGLTVYIAGAKGEQVSQLYSAAPGSVAPITATLSSRVQQAAESALATVPQQAMAVVIQPSTGNLLAVAENPAAAAAGDNPLTGLYPPGSTFKIVTASAALQAGKITVSQPVPCPGTTTIEGVVVPNENKFDLGTVPVMTAFAQSCNTTFSQVAAGLTADSLPTAAKQLGIGVNYAIPNYLTNTGSVPADSDIAARAEDGFGQGKDLVSPFGMALAAATVVHGSVPTPSLINGQHTTADSQPPPLPAQTQSSLQQLMRAVVTDGTAKQLAGVNPPVAGKTGTAQFGDGTHSHGWFVGYQGDLAFAFLLVDGGSSTPAVTVAGHFLASIG